MLISVRDLSEVWKVNPTAVLHVGAHLAEEEPEYQAYCWGHITWIEAQPSLVAILKGKLHVATNKIIQAAAWDISGKKLQLNIASNSQSTSLLNFGTHSNSYPEITFVSQIEVDSCRLEDILPLDSTPDFVNLDIQGIELQALKGMESRLPQVKWIYSEVNLEEVYVGCTQILELDSYLTEQGFRRLYTSFAQTGTWGDALYAREDLYSTYNLLIMNIRQFLRTKIQKPLKDQKSKLGRMLRAS